MKRSEVKPNPYGEEGRILKCQTTFHRDPGRLSTNKGCVREKKWIILKKGWQGEERSVKKEILRWLYLQDL